jgi:hypothetical protein
MVGKVCEGPINKFKIVPNFFFKIFENHLKFIRQNNKNLQRKLLKIHLGVFAKHTLNTKKNIIFSL